MSSAEDSGMPSAADLITYIGVPLTIIGLLPIAYNGIVTLVHLHKVKRDLKSNYIDAKVHSDIFNRLVEVEFAKYIIRPPQSRSETDDANNYSTSSSSSATVHSSATRSSISGGSWTFLCWQSQPYGTTTQRTQPRDTLRQPQARVRFWDLISRLYELGGLPNDKGWCELHDSPLWAQTHPLMILQDSRRKSTLELRVTPPRDSDGTISLKLVQEGPHVNWESEHGRRGRPGTVTLPRAEAASEITPGAAAIQCGITSKGLEAASDAATSKTLNIEHLRIKGGEGCQGIWFASCAAVLSVRSHTPILEYRIPATIRQLMVINTIPDGVIKSLYSAEAIDEFELVVKDYLDERRQNSKEVGGIKWSQSSVPIDDDERIMRNLREGSRSRMYNFTSLVEKALDTPASELSELKTAIPGWLRAHGYFSDTITVEEATREVLARMVREKPFSESLCQILERWRGWASRGAMNLEDFCVVYQFRAEFAQAILVITLTGLENGNARTLISMQECADKGEYVELG